MECIRTDGLGIACAGGLRCIAVVLRDEYVLCVKIGVFFLNFDRCSSNIL